jgi:hypothetical protein
LKIIWLDKIWEASMLFNYLFAWILTHCVHINLFLTTIKCMLPWCFRPSTKCDSDIGWPSYCTPIGGMSRANLICQSFSCPAPRYMSLGVEFGVLHNTTEVQIGFRVSVICLFQVPYWSGYISWCKFLVKYAQLLHCYLLLYCMSLVYISC